MSTNKEIDAAVDNILKESDDLEHSGIKGMKWGRRRFQNPDGSLTPAGRERYNKNSDDAVEGEVFGEGKKGPKKDKETVIDADFTEVKTKINKKDSNSSSDTQQTNTNKSDNKLYAPAKIASQVSEGATRAEKVNDLIGSIKNKKQTKQELESMSNEELQKKLNRMRLEDEYTSRTSTRRTSGHEFVSNSLKIGSAVAGVAVNALTIAALIKELNK